MYNPILQQGLTVALTAAERAIRTISIPTGVEYTDTDSSGRNRTFRYMKNDSGATLAIGDSLVPKDADGLKTPATATIAAAMPLYISMAVMSDAEYGWFQVKGVATAKVTANASGSAISVGDWLVTVNGVRTLAIDGTTPVFGYAIALEAATAAGSISILLPYR